MSTDPTQTTPDGWISANEAIARVHADPANRSDEERVMANEIERLRAAYLDLARAVVADYDGVEGYVSSGTAHSAKRAVADEVEPV